MSTAWPIAAAAVLLAASGLPDTHAGEGGEQCPGELIESILEQARSYLGTPYVYGGADSTGFDCSGLAWRVYNDHGVDLPRTVSAMAEAGRPVPRDSLAPGDIMLFDDPVHTGIYLGGGEFIHCSSWRDRGVVITPIDHSNYLRRYAGAVRIVPSD
jgi:cell wall-associated NlpC family hydrolase